MIRYIKRSFSKLTEDALGKALYDIIKYFLFVLTPSISFYLIAANSYIGKWLDNKVSVTYWQLGLFTMLVIGISITTYFLINRKKFAVIKTDLRTDELTGLLNNRALTEDIIKVINWAKSDNKPFSIILMDIDDFKKLNTDHSLKVADEVLVKLGGLLGSERRVTDSVYRQHVKGDEFVFILKETILQEASLAAERKKKTIADTQISIPNEQAMISITVCCGVVEFQPKEDDEKSILERGFSAMKEAKKKKGKNAIVSLV